MKKFPVFSLLNREFGREEFARDCTHRQRVSPFFLRPGLTPLCPAIAGISRIQPDTFIFSGAAFLASCPNTRSNLKFQFEWDIYQILKDLNF